MYNLGSKGEVLTPDEAGVVFIIHNMRHFLELEGI
jgi:hypothetical protein